MLSHAYSYYMFTWDDSSPSAPLRSSVSNSPFKSEIIPTTLNLRTKHWTISSGLVSMRLFKVQIQFFFIFIFFKGWGWGKEKDNLLDLCQGPYKIFHDLSVFSSSFSTPWMQLIFLFLYLLVSFLPIHIHTHRQTNNTEKMGTPLLNRWKMRRNTHTLSS